MTNLRDRAKDFANERFPPIEGGKDTDFLPSISRGYFEHLLVAFIMTVSNAICACGHEVSEHKAQVSPDNSRKMVCIHCTCGQLRPV